MKFTSFDKFQEAISKNTILNGRDLKIAKNDMQ